MAFNNLDIENTWDEQDIQDFVDYVLEEDKLYLAIDRFKSLMIGSRKDYPNWGDKIKWVKYSLLIN